MSDGLSEIKRTLLGLLGGRAPPVATDWEALDAMAAAHRLQPLLGHRAETGGALPPAIAGRWRAAMRASALTSLAQQAALRMIAARLGDAGINFCALKGPRLAWRDYPEPALRPMRDLDLLVAPGEVVRAAELLAHTGFAMAGDEAVKAEALAHDKHLPIMWHAGLGVAIELHHRLVDPPARHGYRTPQLDPASVLARAETLDLAGAMVRCPAASDLLAHLMVHALYGHRLDCGPLVLADIHFLLASAARDGSIDAPRFLAEAEAGGWARGARLLLALTERYFGPLPATGWRDCPAPPEPVLAAAEEALLPAASTRDHAAALSDLLAARSPRALAVSLGRRLAPSREVIVREGGGRAGWRFWPLWAGRRLARLAARLSDRRAMREGREAAALMRWLQS